MTQPFSCNLQYHAKSFFFPSLCSLRFNNINRKNVISFFPLKSLNNVSPFASSHRFSPRLEVSQIIAFVQLFLHTLLSCVCISNHTSISNIEKEQFGPKNFCITTLPTQTWSIWWKCIIAFLRVANNFSFKNFFSSLWC